MAISEGQLSPEDQQWIRNLCKEVNEKLKRRREQGGPLLELFDDLSAFAELLINFVQAELEDAGQPTNNIDTLTLVQTIDAGGFPRYVVKLKNVTMMLQDPHCIGDFRVICALYGMGDEQTWQVNAPEEAL